MVKKILWCFLHLFWIFPVKKNRIVFQSFFGIDYSDSCKAVIDYIEEKYPDRFEMYWVTKNPDKPVFNKGSKLKAVKKHTLKFIWVCLTSKVIVCNINPETYLPFRSSQKVANIWHGMPYKAIGKDVTGSAEGFKSSSLFMSHNKWYTDRVIRQAFEFSGEVLECGIPRNDILFKPDDKALEEGFKRQYGINPDSKLLLFAPTFRGEIIKGGFEVKDLNLDLDYNSLKEALSHGFGGDWVILFRSHPMYSKGTNNFPGIINVSQYPDMAELLKISDVLITDYSSSMWDFSLAKKPVFLYAPDLKSYSDGRGFYVDMEKLPYRLAHSNEELSELICGFDNEVYINNLDEYFKSVGNFENGHATECLVKKIEEWCNER